MFNAFRLPRRQPTSRNLPVRLPEWSSLRVWTLFVLIGCCAAPLSFGQFPSSSDPAPKRTPRLLPDGSADNTSDEDDYESFDDYVPPSTIVRKTLAPPPGAQQLSTNHLWVDREQARVYIDGYVTMREGPLEMFACSVGTKEHESIVATLAPSREVHAALLLVGAKAGTPVSFLPRFVPATGQRIRVWVCYYDEDGDFQVSDARRWVRKDGTENDLKEDWVFGGSSFWKDPADGREYYQADGGDMICVSNFSTAMMDLPIASSAEAADLLYTPYTDRIPDQVTPVRLVLVPIPVPSDKPDVKSSLPAGVDPDTPPKSDSMPLKKEETEAETPSAES